MTRAVTSSVSQAAAAVMFSSGSGSIGLEAYVSPKDPTKMLLGWRYSSLYGVHRIGTIDADSWIFFRLELDRRQTLKMQVAGLP